MKFKPEMKLLFQVKFQFSTDKTMFKWDRVINQTSANNSTLLRYSKKNHYSANIQGRIVGRKVGVGSSTCILDEYGE